jgi:DNA-binding ferritin-like protein
LPEKPRASLDAVTDRLEEFRDVLDFIAERLRTKGCVTLKDIEALKKRRTKKLTEA